MTLAHLDMDPDRSADPGEAPLKPAAIRLAGRSMLIDPSGVVFDPGTATLIVSDLHLEKGSSFAVRRQFLPPYDTAITLRKLGAAMRRFLPRRVVALGDSFHDRSGPSRLSDPDRAALCQLVDQVDDWIWISGNHDPEPPEGLGGTGAESLDLGGLALCHQPTADTGNGRGEIAGHLHPSVTVRGRLGAARRPAFVASEWRLVMPAFGAFTGGLNVNDAAFRPIFPQTGRIVWALGETRVYPLRSAF